MGGIRSVLLVLAGLAWLPFALPAEAQAPRAERPTYALGEKWIRNDGNYALTRIEDDLYIFTAGPGQEIHLTRNLTLAGVRTARSLVTFDAAPVLGWPLTVGQVRSTPGTWRPPPYISPNVANGTFTWKVEAYEEVRVAAGTFKAYRISLAIEPAPTTYGEHARAVDLTFWYAPEARQLVKAESRDVPSLAFEVVRLERPAPPPVAAQPPPSPPGGSLPAPAAPRPSPAPPATATPAPPRPTPAPSGAALQITVSLPPDRVDQQTTALAGVVSAGVGVSWVVVALNGEEVSRLGGPTPLRALAVNVPLKLREGKNTLVITAGSADGSTRQEVRAITYEPPSLAATGPTPPPPAPLIAPDRWAVVIGIGQYENADIPRLRYAVPDAEAIYQTLIGPAGFKKEHVLLLTDRTERKPTTRNLRWALGTFLARSAKKDDLVLIFFAGHGAPEADPRGIERDGLAKYLVPVDADPDDLYSTALPMDEIQTIFGRIEADRVVAFLDTCYSGAAGGRTFTSKKTRASHVDDLFLERLTRSKGRAIVTASRPAEVSIELPELGHGIFTYYLVRGLQGAADLDRDGIVSLQELYDYVERQVTQKSRAVGGNQHPLMKGELEGVLPLVKVGGR